MRVISWNIQAGGGNRKAKLVDAVIARRPDVVTFQEVTPWSVEPFRELFRRTELAYFADSFPRCNAGKLSGCRAYGELVASRWELEQIASTSFGAPWAEKVLSVDLKSPHGKIELHSVHLPNGSSNGWTKIDMFEAIYKRLARNVEHHRILCGDFNSPLQEMGTVRSGRAARKPLDRTGDTSSVNGGETDRAGGSRKSAGTWPNDKSYKACVVMISAMFFAPNTPMVAKNSAITQTIEGNGLADASIISSLRICWKSLSASICRSCGCKS
jgi:endonuclease/exonuclease/phosphatase family metal-dependent hydrolase